MSTYLHSTTFFDKSKASQYLEQGPCYLILTRINPVVNKHLIAGKE